MAYSNGKWKSYWNKFSNINQLQKMAENMDETLRRLEKDSGKKLMAKDHMEIIMALEERLAELETGCETTITA